MTEEPKKPVDWFRVAVHFTFGAFIGACFGLMILQPIFDGIYDFLPTIGLALLLGTFTAVFGGRFL
jgi:hypothetical protein